MKISASFGTTLDFEKKKCGSYSIQKYSHRIRCDMTKWHPCYYLVLYVDARQSFTSS